MRKLFGALVGAALLVGAGAAGAAEETGTIQSIDAEERTITLDTGKNFKLGPSVTLAQLRMGTKVKVSYEEQGGQNVAKEVVPTNASGNDTVNPPSSVNPPAGPTGPAMREAPGTGN